MPPINRRILVIDDKRDPQRFPQGLADARTRAPRRPNWRSSRAPLQAVNRGFEVTAPTRARRASQKSGRRWTREGPMRWHSWTCACRRAGRLETIERSGHRPGNKVVICSPLGPRLDRRGVRLTIPSTARDQEAVRGRRGRHRQPLTRKWQNERMVRRSGNTEQEVTARTTDSKPQNSSCATWRPTMRSRSSEPGLDGHRIGQCMRLRPAETDVRRHRVGRGPLQDGERLIRHRSATSS